MAYLSLSGPNMDPSWLKLGPCWTQVGSNLAQVGPMLGPDPSPQPPLSQPKPFQTPSLWPLELPNPHLCPTRPNIDPKRAPKPPTYTSTTPNLEPKRPQHGSKRHLPRFQILLPRPGRMGHSLFNISTLLLSTLLYSSLLDSILFYYNLLYSNIFY